MMLERRQQHALAVAVGEARGDQVNRLGRAAGEDQLALVPADQVGGGFARRLEALRHRRRAFVDAAMHGRIIAAISVGDGVDHRLRLLRGGGGIEIMPAGDRGELVADAERGIEAGLDVHAIAFNAVRAATAISLSSPSASHKPPTNPSSNSARADAGSSPRAAA